MLLLLIEEILHQLIDSLSHYLQGFIHPRWCRISAIYSINWSDYDIRMLIVIVMCCTGTGTILYTVDMWNKHILFISWCLIHFTYYNVMYVYQTLYLICTYTYTIINCHEFDTSRCHTHIPMYVSPSYCNLWAASNNCNPKGDLRCNCNCRGSFWTSGFSWNGWLFWFNPLRSNIISCTVTMYV